MSKITHVDIRMYKMGTGDCFTLKFYADVEVRYKMMIDCGTWSGGTQYLTDYIVELKKDMEDHIDLLVVTHEHKDHVHVFDACKDLLKPESFTVDRTWMAWTEEDSKQNIKEWQAKYGDKKKSLAIAAGKLQNALNDPSYKAHMEKEFKGINLLASRQDYANIISEFAALQMDINSATGDYIGPLAGMKMVKDTISKGKIDYFKPGKIINNIPKLDGITFYVLGPPESCEEVKLETGGEGESYSHNKELAEGRAFSSAILAMSGETSENVLPFDKAYEAKAATGIPNAAYNRSGDEWRKIDNDWLSSAGSLSLRMNSMTNNLSLALAIEFEDSGRVMLFPGDAEFGSWASWHKIPWSVPSRKKNLHFTHDLLDRTVFYKVAHHLSHHGTAEKQGLKMMTSPDLVSMATLDYNIIAPRWTGTMPNIPLLKDLLPATKGRLMIMNTDKLLYNRKEKITLADQIEQERRRMTAAEAAEFNRYFKNEKHYIQYTVKG